MALPAPRRGGQREGRAFRGEPAVAFRGASRYHVLRRGVAVKTVAGPDQNLFKRAEEVTGVPEEAALTRPACKG